MCMSIYYILDYLCVHIPALTNRLHTMLCSVHIQSDSQTYTYVDWNPHVYSWIECVMLIVYCLSAKLLLCFVFVFLLQLEW